MLIPLQKTPISQIGKPNIAWLLEQQPLLICANLLEFKQRLQWLSEGMLSNHLEPKNFYIRPDQKEIDDYLEYKRLCNEVDPVEQMILLHEFLGIGKKPKGLIMNESTWKKIVESVNTKRYTGLMN